MSISYGAGDDELRNIILGIIAVLLIVGVTYFGYSYLASTPKLPAGYKITDTIWVSEADKQNVIRFCDNYDNWSIDGGVLKQKAGVRKNMK